MFILVYVHLLQLQRPRSHIRAIRNIRVRLILKQQSRVRLPIRVLSVIRVRHSQATESHRLIREICEIRVLLKTPLRVLCAIRVSVVFTQNLSQKRNRLRCQTKQASLALEASFIAQRSKLHFFGVFS